MIAGARHAARAIRTPLACRQTILTIASSPCTRTSTSSSPPNTGAIILLHAGVCHVALIASSRRSPQALDFLRKEGFGEG